MAQPAPSLLTASEYLAIERSSTIKHELFQGQMVAMAGASLEHNVIVANIVAALHAGLRDRPCRDRGDKFHDYRSISSCTDYLMCSSTEPLVEHYTRDADGWRLREYGPGELLPLRGVELSLSVAEVYAKAFGNR